MMIRGAVWCVALLMTVNAFPNGAPKSACKSLKPSHGLISAQKDKSPYVLEVSKQQVKSLKSDDNGDLQTITGNYSINGPATAVLTDERGALPLAIYWIDIIDTRYRIDGFNFEFVLKTVTLKGDDENKFRGFVLQARGEGDDIGIGTFTADKSGKVLECSDSKVSYHYSMQSALIMWISWHFLLNYQGTVTHTNRDEKSSVSFKWSPPLDYEGKVSFRYYEIDKLLMKSLATDCFGWIAQLLCRDSEHSGQPSNRSPLLL